MNRAFALPKNDVLFSFEANLMILLCARFVPESDVANIEPCKYMGNSSV